MPPLTVVFDLDGTLVDTAGDLVATLNLMLAQEGLKPLSMAEARPLIGHGARALLKAGLEANGAPPETEWLDALTARFLSHYSLHIADHSTAFPGVREALDLLKVKNCTLAVCTNKNESLAMQLLAALELKAYFTVIVGSTRFPYIKPDPRMLLETIALAGGVKDASIMIGDSMTDTDTAIAASIPSIAVDFGYTSIPPHELGANTVISHYNELCPAIAALCPQLTLP